MKYLYLLFFSVLLSVPTWSQVSPKADTATAITYDRLPENGILLNKGWKYHRGDQPNGAAPDLDDRAWKPFNPTLAINDLLPIHPQGIGWLRLHLRLSDSVRLQPLMLYIQQLCASEIYLNGRLIKRFGTVSNHPDSVEAYNPFSEPVGLYFANQPDQLLAIRFAAWNNKAKLNQSFLNRPLLAIRLQGLPLLLETHTARQRSDLVVTTAFGICLLLSFLHIIFFVYNRAQRANLYFAGYTISLTLLFFVFLSYDYWNKDIDLSMYVASCIWLLLQIIFLWPLRALYCLFDRKPNVLFYGLWVFLPVNFLLVAFSKPPVWAMIVLLFLPILVEISEQLRLTIQAVRQRKRGAGIIAGGFAFAALLLVGYILLQTLGIYFYDSTLFFLLVLLSPALSISLFLAREFALDSQLLQVKLRQVQQLSAQTVAQEQEKQHLLAAQNETLERQVKERTAQLQQSLDELKTTQNQLIQKEKMASLGELTAGIAHEIQNPLNFVNNFSEVSSELIDELKEGPFQHLPETEQEYASEIIGDLTQNLQKINHHGKRADNIVKGMLEHSRSSTGQKGPTNLNALADEYLKLAYHGLRAKDKSFNAQLITNFDKKLALVQANPQDLGRVLLNLFNNAFYAVQEKTKQAGPGYQPTVTVSTYQHQNQVEIRVEDNGTGIPEAAKQKIFQPFFTTKPTGQGTGLGLSLSYDIITKGHGGTLSVETQAEEGTQMQICLPL
ncbi:ATP-binding protein [Tellurirhabdus bombi]|uniref:ATP-binding protein n=1 Tax=Tellurirhabdus bombi TaxID=2907205 RepID=UPI001F1E7A0B|nr:ATP-binding protein [Tellurirhabdus bombi]